MYRYDGEESPSVSYRHDGNSPLPLGMEWSRGPPSAPPASGSSGVVGSKPQPGPASSGAMESAWAGAPPDAWCFTVSIPSWVSVTPPTPGSSSSAQSPHGPLVGPLDAFSKPSPVVLYRVAVQVRSPRGTVSSHRLLRRFSDFLKLHAALQKQFPSKSIPPPPPKHRFLFVSSNDTLISQRRVALDAWLREVLEDLELSRSHPAAAFLDLLEAARVAALSMESEASHEPSSDRAAQDESGQPLSDKLLEAYLARRKGVSALLQDSGSAGIASTAGSSGLPSPSPPNSLYRALSSSSLASLPNMSDADVFLEDPGSSRAGRTAPRQMQVSGAVLPPLDRIEPSETLPQGPIPAASQAALNTDRQSPLDAFGDADRSAEPRELEPASLQDSAGVPGRVLESTAAGFPGPPPQQSNTSAGPPSSAAVSGISAGSIDSAAGQPKAEGPLHPLPEVGMGTDGDILVLSEDKQPVVHRHLAALRRRLQGAQADMTALVERLQQETAVTAFLSSKVKDVEAELDLERRNAAAAVQHAVADRDERLIALEWGLEEERARLAEAQAAVSAGEARERALQEQVQAMKQEWVRLRGEREKEQEEGAQREKERAAEGLRLKAELKALAKEVKSLRRALASSQKEAAQGSEEIAAYQELLREEDHRSATLRHRKERVMHEVHVLAARLRDTAVTTLAGEGGSTLLANGKLQEGSSAQGSDAGFLAAQLAENLQLLSTSDARIDVILAEAKLLQELPDWSAKGVPLGPSSAQNGRVGNWEDSAAEEGEESAEAAEERAQAAVGREMMDAVQRRWGLESSSDRELLHALLGLLIESANHRRSINALLRHAFASTAPE